MTREEAIKEIKSWAIPSKNGRKVLETLIPELTESEDERARKWLLDYAIEMIAGLESDISLSNYDGIKGHDPEAEAELAQWQKARAYLEKQKNLDKMIVVSPEVWDKAISDAYENGKKDEEKQKEQKPDSLIYDKDLDKAAREFYLSGGAASPVDSTGLVPIVRMAEFGATWMKERMEKEQKPCWNPTEEDVALFNKAITTNASLSPQERAKLDILRMKFKHRPVIEQKEQKPAEWSDTNELVFKDICKHLKEEGYNGWVVLLNALRNGEFQSKQEWSEEDERKYQCIRNILLTDMDKKVGSWKYSEILEWYEKRGIGRYTNFKSHWKPSEEQMEAVKHAYNSFPNDCSTKSNLRFLYHDLEKLGVREEPEYYQHFDPDC